MDQDLIHAVVFGYERMVSWADLLDQINVFPVADSDTGRNLKISLAPLRQFDGDSRTTIQQLLSSATGNSGNIAAVFFTGFLTCPTREHLLTAAEDGRRRAWQAVGDPKPGTMLTVFNEFVRTLEHDPMVRNKESAWRLIGNLRQAVRATSEKLPALRQAGVVDAGALGMYLYLEGLCGHLVGETASFRPVTETFRGKLQIATSYVPRETEGHCVDTVIRLDAHMNDAKAALAGCGNSMVTLADGDYLKIHLHTKDPQALRHTLMGFGDVVRWEDDPMEIGAEAFAGTGDKPRSVHIMTDAAGSMTRKTAQSLGVTLLESYIVMDGKSVPETQVSPAALYADMKKGKKVSTAQASLAERHEAYGSVMERFEQIVYLCVGSVYTGNFEVATAWKARVDKEDRFTVIDTGAASGRLSTIAIATARYAETAGPGKEVIRFAQKAVGTCEEYVFLDRLEYLVAGGRISKTRGFFGDLLHMKPVISPTAEGATQVGLTRSREDQIRFALERLADRIRSAALPYVLLQYTDNKAWVNNRVRKAIESRYPQACIACEPLSLTSGVHMGPGTWALAFLPECP